MKTIQTYPKAAFFAFALSCFLAFSLSTCTEGDLPDLPEPPPTAQEATLSVRVTVGNDISNTRVATGNLDPETVAGKAILAAEEKIHHIEVWIFNNGKLEAYAKSDPETPHQVEDIPLMAGSKLIFIAANANIGAVDSKTGTVFTQNGLMNQTAQLSQNISTGMIMTADPTHIVVGAGSNIYGEPIKTVYDHYLNQSITQNKPIPLHRINARIAIASLYTDFPPELPYTYFVLEDIIFFHLRKGSALFPELGTGSNKTLTWQNNTTVNTFLFGSHVPDDKDYPTYIGSPGTLYNGAGVVSEQDVRNVNTSGLLGNSGSTNPYGFIAERSEDLWAQNIALTGGLLPIQHPTERRMIGNKTLSNPNDPFYRNPYYVYSFENTDGHRGGGTFLILKGKLYDERMIAGLPPPPRLFVSEGLQTSKSAGITDDQGNTYYVIWVNRGDMGYEFSGTLGEHLGDGTIRRNTQYNLHIKITRAGTAGTTVINPGTATEVHMFIEPWRSIWQNVEWRP